MRGFTSPLWPIRYKPLPDELLSSWLVRLAHGHGLKVQTFCNIIFGNRLQVWNRDIDRLGPDWLVNELSVRTGTSQEVAYGTTLRAYEGLLYPQFKLSGVLQWILTLKMYHRKHEGFGLQYCPLCLREGPEPYFRKSWRVAFNTVCVTHQCMLRDRCPNCGAGVAFHRRDMGRTCVAATDSLAGCHQCGFDLGEAGAEPITSYDKQAGDWLATLCGQLTRGDPIQSVFNLDSFSVMRHLAMLLTSQYPAVRLHTHVCDRLGVPVVQMIKGRIAIEARPLHERHHLVQLLAWLMMDLEPRLRIAWRAKAVRYNHLGKDFGNAPEWYLKVVDGFADWRRAAKQIENT
jgi:hypothetical protein